MLGLIHGRMVGRAPEVGALGDEGAVAEAMGKIYCSMQYLHIRHPWRKWQRAVPAKSVPE